MTSGLAQKVAKFCQTYGLIHPGERIIVGVSGGPDSLCLLHLLVGLKTRFELSLIVAHLNHQLRGQAAQADETFVREIAREWQLPLRVESHDIAAMATHRKQSIEEAARQVRYGFLWRVATELEAPKIAVGHNADDQVETVLMHLLRGTGLAGLRGMLPGVEITTLRLNPADGPASTATFPPQLIRPLLETSRTEIERYCHNQKLVPRQDYSNQDVTFFRNRLRHELIPHLESYNPNIRQVIQHTAKVVAADFQILQEQLDKSWSSVVTEESSTKIEFDLAGWSGLPLAMKRSTLRRAVHRLRCSLRDINFEHIENAITIIQRGETGLKATLPRGLMVSIGYRSFTVASASLGRSSRQKPDIPALRPDQVVPLQLPGITLLPDSNWQLKAQVLPYKGVNAGCLHPTDPWEAYLDADAAGRSPRLRTRRPGDRFCPLGLEGHSKKVNEFMIDEKIPADQRPFVPLLVTADNQLLWICGYRPDDRARVRPTTQLILHLKFEQSRPKM